MGAVKNSYMDKLNEEEQRWCKVHPLAYWGKDSWGNWYEYCSSGWKLKQRGEKCECVMGENYEE